MKNFEGFLTPSIEEKIICSFQRAVREVPNYKKILKDSHIPIQKIKNLFSFKNFVPLIDKNKTFRVYSSRISSLSTGENLKRVKYIIPSSGHSGYFSFGLVTNEESSGITKSINLLLNYYFQIRKISTLIINCLPMGINIPTTEGVLVNTGVREDTVLALIKGFNRDFGQIIIVGENSFVKNLLEEGTNQNINWKKIRIHLILGEEPFPENFRRYLESLLGKKSLIVSSYGISEFGLNLFYETPQMISLRRLIENRPELKDELLKKKIKITPSLFHYDPNRIYVEEVKGELVITNLKPQAKLPLIRYCSGDLGKVITHQHLSKVLGAFNLSSYLPHSPLPIVMLEGRNEFIKINDTKIFPEQIKAALYHNWKLASFFTGYFRLSKDSNLLKIEIQLKKEKSITPELKQHLFNYLSKELNIKFRLKFYAYERFPYGMELNYEKKFKYL